MSKFGIGLSNSWIKESILRPWPPNWKETRHYPNVNPDETSPLEFAWEFLRRNEQYSQDFIKATKSRKSDFLKERYSLFLKERYSLRGVYKPSRKFRLKSGSRVQFAIPFAKVEV